MSEKSMFGDKKINDKESGQEIIKQLIEKISMEECSFSEAANSIKEWENPIMETIKNIKDNQERATANIQHMLERGRIYLKSGYGEFAQDDFYDALTGANCAGLTDLAEKIKSEITEIENN